MQTWLFALVVTLGGCGSKRDAAPQPSADPKAVIYQAAMTAAPGATECESVLNALKAFDDAAAKANIPPGWDRFPAAADLLARCNALPPEAQFCLVPKHQTDKARCGAVLEALEHSAEGLRYFELVRPPRR